MVKVETVGTLVVVADDSPCHQLLPLPHCGYDKPHPRIPPRLHV